MGMDVFGNHPISELGEYFWANVWYWHPLWDYVETHHYDIAEHVKSPHSNDGDGLNAVLATTLGVRLKGDIISGVAHEYARKYAEQLDALPDIVCVECKGENEDCQLCEGWGTRRPFETWYHFDVATLEEFAVFCQHSGGFKIW